MSLSYGELRPAAGVPDLTPLLDLAAHAFGVSRQQLVGPSRADGLSAFRQVAMAAARRLGTSFPMIGRAFERDHTTVVHACQRVAGDADLSAAAEALVAELGERAARPVRPASTRPAVPCGRTRAAYQPTTCGRN